MSGADLYIKRITFRDFRNFPSLELTNLARLIIVVGDNALGKTNIIEGVQLVSTMDSFRKPVWNDVIRSGCDCARVVVEYRQNGCDNSIVLSIHDNKRSYQFNEKTRSSRELLGLVPAVLFTPSDLQIVQGPAERRRLCIDDLGCQLSRTFVDIKQDYARVVKQKNSLLREEYIDSYIFDSWNRNLIKLGSSLMTHRVALFRRLMEKTRKTYEQIAPNEHLTARYVPSWLLVRDDDAGDDEIVEKNNDESGIDGLITDGSASDRAVDRGAAGRAAAVGAGVDGICVSGARTSGICVSGTGADKPAASELAFMVERYRQLELSRKRALIGPHRDEISFFIDGRDARRFGSQGQQRSIALALKIAEVEVLREVTGTDPILLLDDVMSEIDEGRRRMLLELIDTKTQTLITTTNLGYFDEKTLQHAQIVRLPLEGSRIQPAAALKPTDLEEQDAPEEPHA